jgi:bla regulator protein blaR1
MVLMLVAKSVVIAGATLLLLRLLRRRSASDRSAVAHLGLAAVAILPLGSLLLPSLEVVTPYLSVPAEIDLANPATVVPAMPAPGSPSPASGWTETLDWADWLLLIYAMPALLLVGDTSLALLRLVSLKARARAVTDEHWLRTLAAARQRLGVENRTALLASHEIASPVSWGLTQPVILLNAESLEASGHADAIIAHELAHVIRRDWARLVLSRVTVALFWPNPLAWWLAREAHQLREEAADDAVLAADIDDTSYASLLVSTARREPRGLLPAALGVAPARGSLVRRVQRVLDGRLDRSVGGRRWSGAVALVAAALVVPLAAVQFTPVATASPLPVRYAPVDAGSKPVLISLRVPPARSDRATVTEDAAPVELVRDAASGRETGISVREETLGRVGSIAD